VPRKKPRPATRRGLAILALLAVTLCLPSLAHNPPAFLQSTAHAAASFAVTSTGDGADSNTADGVCNDGAGNCTLRAAIQQANAAAGDDTITFSVTGTIALTSALPDITSGITLSGPGAGLLAVSGNNASRVFTITGSGVVTISDLTITGGRASSGAGISNAGTLNVNNCTVSNNTATDSGGGINNNGAGRLNLDNSTVSGNSAHSGGGIFNFGVSIITNTTISSNNAATVGAGIESVGGLTLRSSTIHRNSAQNAGGGISNPGIAPLTLANTIVAGNFGGLGGPDCNGFNVISQDYNLIQSMANCSMTGATSHNVTGVPALLTPLQYNGGPTLTHAPLPGSPAIDQGNTTLTADQRGQARPTDLPGVANAAAGNGSDIGAVEIQSAELLVVNSLADTTDGACDSQSCTLREALAAANSSADYNAIYFAVAGTINLTSALPDVATDMTIDGPGANVLTVRRNSSNNFRIFTVTAGVRAAINGLTITNGDPALGTGGGGVSNTGTLGMNAVTVSGNNAVAGAGILNSGPGVLTLTNSTLSGNTAGSGGGGGIFNSGGKVNVVNSTISGNAGGFGGGGIYNFVGTTNVTNSTVANNSQRGIWNLNSASSTVILAGSIVADNTGTSGTDLVGAFISRGYNLIRTPEEATINEAENPGTNIIGQNPNLGPLASNGGPTQTHALAAGSPAIDKGRNFAADSGGNTLPRDQRGRPRPFDHPSVAPATGGDNSDIGAFELTTASEAIADKETNEDTPVSFSFFVGDQTVTSLTATSSNQTLVPDAGIVISGTGPERTVTITPAPNQNGTADITVNLTGSSEGTVARTFRLTVRAVNDAPSFTKGPDQTVAEDAGPRFVTNWATAVTAGPNESTQSVTFVVTNNTNPSLFSAGPSVSPAGTLTYTPAPNANGSATITIVLKDNGGTANGGQDTSPAQTFVINVTAVNDAPTASNQTVTTDEDTPRAITLSGSDVEGDALTFVIVSGPSNGALSGTGASRTYTPAADFNGPDSFTYKVVDAHGAESAVATVTVNVTAVNDAPVNTVPGAQLTARGVPVVFSAAGSNAVSVADVDAGGAAVRVALAATNGTLTLGGTAGLTFVNGDGADDAAMTFTGTVANVNAALNGLTFKPSAGFDGAASFQITTDDQGNTGAGGAKTDTDTVNITVERSLVEFAQATYTVAEGGGGVTVTVRRTGDLSQPATVSYATDDGSVSPVFVPCSTVTGRALDRCDYTRAQGTLTFAAGEPQQTFTVLVGDDSYVEGTETATLRLSAPGGVAALGPRTAATLEITDDSPETAGNPNDDSAKFVRQHYHDFLNREPDASGLAHWTSVADNCGDPDPLVCRINVSAAFFLSIEFRETGFLVEKMYKAAFGDATGTSTLGGTPHTLVVPVIRFEEFMPDTQRIGRGVVVLQPGWEAQLEANKVAFFREFVQRQRFLNDFPLTTTPTEFVDRLDQRAGNPLDAAERQALIDELTADNTTAGRASVLRKVAEDATLDAAEKNRAFVLMQYFGYLRRNPNDAPDSDYTGYDFWLTNLDKFNGNFVQAELVKAFILSAEYRQRFGQ